jgi:threonine dehydratase
MAVYGVQAAAASAICDGWHAGEPRSTETADTIADGLATRSCYPMTFPALRDGLAGFVKVSEGELAEAVRAYLIGAHSLAEPAGAAGLAGLRQLGPELAGKRVAVILSGGNIDFDLLGRIVAREI